MMDILSVTDLFALAAVMLIGLPHGAFDGALAFCLGFGRSPGKIIGFLVMYLLLAGLSALIWLVSPVFALAAFLVLTIVHFGSGDTEHLFQQGPRVVQRSLKACQILVHGGMVTILLPVFHTEEVSQLFIVLAGPNAVLIMDALRPALTIWLAAACIYAGAALFNRQYGAAAGELAGLAVLVWLLPPLAGFAVYFCVVHSRRHFTSIWKAMQLFVSRRFILISGGILTAASWAMGAGLYFSQTMSGSFSPDEAFIRAVFILLAALTVPHMLLVDTMYRPTLKKITQP